MSFTNATVEISLQMLKQSTQHNALAFPIKFSFTHYPSVKRRNQNQSLILKYTSFLTFIFPRLFPPNTKLKHTITVLESVRPVQIENVNPRKPIFSCAIPLPRRIIPEQDSITNNHEKRN